MKKRLIIILLILVAGGAAMYYSFRGSSRRPGDRIVISGNIELTEVSIGFKTAGRLVERNVDEGDTVKKGQVIARLDRDQLVAQHEREAAGFASAEAQLAQAETSLEWQKQTLAGDVEQKRGDLSSNEARLSELENGSRPQEKLDAKAAVDAASSEVDRSKRDWDRAQTLYKNDDISTSQFDQARTKFSAANAQFAQAEDRAKLVQALHTRGFLVKGPFGAPCLADCIRITLGPPELMARFCDALEDVLDGR